MYNNTNRLTKTGTKGVCYMYCNYLYRILLCDNFFVINE